MFAATLGEWTLDYPACDPDAVDATPEELSGFRGGLLRVDEHNAAELCASLIEVTPDVLRRWIATRGREAVRLSMLVDFDRRLFIHGYREPVEPRTSYLPEGWSGMVADPLDHAPAELRELWEV